MLPFCESGCFVTGTGTYVFLKDKQLFLGLCEKEEKEVKTARGGTNPEKGKIIFCYFFWPKSFTILSALYRIFPLSSHTVDMESPL